MKSGRIEPQCRKRRFGPVLYLVAVQTFKTSLKLSQFPKEAFPVIPRGGMQFRFQGINAPLDAPNLRKTAFAELNQRHLGTGAVQFLVQITEPTVLGQRHGAAISAHVTGDQAKQRAFAGAVGTNDPHPFTGADTKRSVMQNLLGAEAFAHVLEFNHRIRRKVARIVDRG